MKFFLDTANVDDIRHINDLGLCDGVTTNPTLVGKEGRPFEEVIKEICSIVDGPVSAEVIGKSRDEMIEEARKISKWADNIVVKIPMTEEGLAAIHTLSAEGIKTNCTLIFSVNQGLMACKAGATYVSPFIGRIDDIGEDGLEVVDGLRQVIDNYGFDTQIIAASIRTVHHVEACALIGADIATIPGKIFPQMWSHPLTDKGLINFEKDWENYLKDLDK